MERSKISPYRKFMHRTFMYRTTTVTVLAAITSHTAMTSQREKASGWLRLSL